MTIAYPFPQTGLWKEMVNSDALHYGGSGIGNLGAVTAQTAARR